MKIEDWLEYDGLAEHACILGAVHDSVLFEIDEAYALEVLSGAARIMEDYPDDTGVPLVVDGELGPDWGHLEKIKLAA